MSKGHAENPDHVGSSEHDGNPDHAGRRTLVVETADADATRALGARLAALLRAGDLVMLSGALGAGKTTLAQGIGSAMDVRGRVSSPREAALSSTRERAALVRAAMEQFAHLLVDRAS